VENTVAHFYPDDPSSSARAPLLLDSLATRSQEVIFANMKQSVSLTLRILKSLYPHDNGFAASCTNEEALKLMEDSAIMAD
jgi:hypothetical protein